MAHTTKIGSELFLRMAPSSSLNSGPFLAGELNRIEKVLLVKGLPEISDAPSLIASSSNL